jgi:quercetin dioxygenase-like cupin family protein
MSITRKAHLEGNVRGPEPARAMPLNLNIARLNAQVVEFQPGAPSTALSSDAETVGVIYVLEGKLHLDAGGLVETLETGDCACIDSEMPMAWSAGEKSACRVLAVLAAKKD